MGNDYWRTPDQVFQHWASRYDFTLDAAANEYDAKCDLFIPPEVDSLSTPWSDVTGGPGVAWCNPPYSQTAGPLSRWVEMFEWEAFEDGWTTVALLPADTSTKWWDKVWDRGSSEWRPWVRGHFLSPRVRHKLPAEGEPGHETGKTEGSPTWGSAILIFTPPEDV